MLDVRRRCAQTARISLHNQIFKEPSSDKKRAMRQLLGVSLRALSSDFPDFPLACAFVPFRHRRVSASVKRYLRRGAGSRKREKDDLCKIFDREGKDRKILGLAQDQPQGAGCSRNFLSRRIVIGGRFARLRQSRGQDRRDGAADAAPEGQLPALHIP